MISYQDRELATIAALANMTGTEGQLRFHLGAAMNTGMSKVQMKDFISIFAAKVDKKKDEQDGPVHGVLFSAGAGVVGKEPAA